MGCQRGRRGAAGTAREGGCRGANAGAPHLRAATRRRRAARNAGWNRCGTGEAASSKPSSKAKKACCSRAAAAAAAADAGPASLLPLLPLALPSGPSPHRKRSPNRAPTEASNTRLLSSPTSSS